MNDSDDDMNDADERSNDGENADHWDAGSSDNDDADDRSENGDNADYWDDDEENDDDIFYNNPQPHVMAECLDDDGYHSDKSDSSVATAPIRAHKQD
jgi:hypothetical protein